MSFIYTWIRQCAMVVKNLIRGFIQDIIDHSAEKISNPNWAVDGLTTIGIVTLAASGQAEAAQKLVSQMIGDVSGVVQFLFLLVAVLWCIAVIAAKTKRKQLPGVVSVVDSHNRRSYVYSQPLRNAAKIGLLLFVAVAPFKLHAMLDEELPLSKTIYGYMFYDTSKPVDGANIRLISSDGSDITDGSWMTDSRGFYIVKAIRRLRRSDVLNVMPDGCATQVSLTLKKSNERQNNNFKPALSPLFNHIIHCDGNK